MRIESSVTSISWIPSEAIPGLMKLPFKFGPFHYDDPPGDRLPPLPELAASGNIRFANELRAWIEVDRGLIREAGHAGRGWMGITRLEFGGRSLDWPAVSLHDLRPEPITTGTACRFVQTTGGRVNMPMPRRVSRPPFVQLMAPLVWTTLGLTLHADGRVEHEVDGASPFPRHWIYDNDGKLVEKSGIADFKTWAGEIFGHRTPWGAEDSPAVVTEVESELERKLSTTIMRGGTKPKLRTVEAGKTLVEQGDAGHELYLLLDGVLAVEVNGEVLAEIGPGAILGERALLEGGKRTATLRAVHPARVAVATADEIAPEVLAELAKSHRREDN